MELSDYTTEQLHEELARRRSATNFLKVKKTSRRFCFILDYDNDWMDEDEYVVLITRTAFYDKNHHLEDARYERLVIPDFLHESMENTYRSDLSKEETRAKMLELGFVERKWYYLDGDEQSESH